MHQIDSELKMYGVNGLRTAEEWSSLGRGVRAGSEPRANASHHGQTVLLYTRDQTQHRPETSAS